jgi:hypothetical protein
MSHDGCDGRLGWFLDDVRVGFCGFFTLPVEFFCFTALGGENRVDLSWETAAERDSAEF